MANSWNQTKLLRSDIYILFPITDQKSSNFYFLPQCMAEVVSCTSCQVCEIVPRA